MYEGGKIGRWGREEMPGGPERGTTGKSDENCTRWQPSRVPTTKFAKGKSDQQDNQKMNGVDRLYK